MQFSVRHWDSTLVDLLLDQIPQPQLRTKGTGIAQPGRQRFVKARFLQTNNKGLHNGKSCSAGFYNQPLFFTVNYIVSSNSTVNNVSGQDNHMGFFHLCPQFYKFKPFQPNWKLSKIIYIMLWFHFVLGLSFFKLVH